MALLAIRHFVTSKSRGRIILVGDALGVWYGLVRMKARTPKVNEIALHLAPLGHELVGIHVWSEVNVVADALSRIGSHTAVPEDCVMCAGKRCAPGDHRIGLVWELWRTQCECGWKGHHQAVAGSPR